MSNLTANIKSIRDIMRKDTGVDGDAQRISQMVWMLFLKIFADKENEWETQVKNYVSPIPVELKWQNWAADTTGLTGEPLIEFINSELFPTLKSLKNTTTDQAKIVRSVFEDTYNYMKNGVLFRQVINEINKIDFSDSHNGHIFNDIYENILKELQSAGSSGEYYTPRAVTQFMVDIIKPKIGESVLDPACGTGGFLKCTINSLGEYVYDSKNRSILQDSIRGIEKKPLPHLLCTTNLMLHGFDVPSIRRDNLLSKKFDEWEAKDEVNIILSNPPFGGAEEDGTDSNFPIQFRTKETADLFMVLIMRLLKPSGRAAVVLPDGFLFGEGVRTRIKEELLATCNLHTIVRLPNGVFNPYTNIKTNILFFDKGSSTKDIWYYEHPYPKGQKSYNRSRPISIEEFNGEKSWWNNRTETDYTWKVSIEEIKGRNYNLDISSPYFGKTDEQLTSSEIIKRLEKSIKRSEQLMSLIKQDI
ncbi:class I SAM-dependent DNA methyltransferase [Pedobacter caeni]|uniref:site-specific DNA-methyltransferase (adenine-specific) n=1 Tax=Pedobacter caeni TaxID=288992 RepID=A0A1M5KUT4_9SPHI|nr:N-6 DNA methylase [Pedobacter caeni]SHG56440.1 type I restriction enzyme M protein [Pedobacter caeni]